MLLIPGAPLPLLREAARAVFVASHAALDQLDELVASRTLVDQE